MKIRGIPIGIAMPRIDYAETNPNSPAFIRNKPDEAIQAAQEAANYALTASGEAKTKADNAQTTADEAKTAAGNAQAAADNAHARADEAMTAAQNAKDYADSKRLFTVVQVTASGWSSSAPYTQRIAVEGILTTDNPHYSVVYSDDLQTKLAQKEAFAMVDDLDTEDGFVTLTCFEEKPEVSISIQMEVNR